MVETVDNSYRKPQFDMGRVINRTFGAIRNNFFNFMLASILIMGLPTFVIGLWPILLGSGGMFDGDAINSSFMVGVMITGVLSLIIVMIGSVILQGALMFGAIEDFNGRKATFGECISVAVKYFFPLFGLGILVVLGILLGYLLLIIPGIILTLGWLVAVPVLIVEDKTVTESISRSWELTNGYKGWIFLLMVIYIILGAVIGGVFGLFIGIAGDPATIMLEGGTPTFFFVNALFSGLSQAVTTMISATGVAAIYYEIRQIKEGIGAESLAEVFD